VIALAFCGMTLWLFFDRMVLLRLRALLGALPRDNLLNSRAVVLAACQPGQRVITSAFAPARQSTRAPGIAVGLPGKTAGFRQNLAVMCRVGRHVLA
jgi:hypothetical protein